MVAPHSIPAEKAALRRTMLARRAALDPAAIGAAIAAHVLALPCLPPVLAGYWPIGEEPDLRPLWYALSARGHTVLLPQTPGRGERLIFRVWSPDTPMVPERFGTLRPDGPAADPALIFVPLLAFDAAGRRLGYGGGFYDRTLAAYPGVPAAGLAPGALRVPVIPEEAWDRPLDAVITETGIAVSRGLWPKAA